MRAMRLEAPGRDLVEAELDDPQPGSGELLLDVLACGVCRTDLHIRDGELAPSRLPIVPGHQVVGRVHGEGRLVGVPWLAWTCGACRWCVSGRENLCPQARFTGLHRDGGYATRMTAVEDFCLPLPDGADSVSTAPLLCAGLIGHRALRRAGDAALIGLYGFGASAHLVCQVARFEGRRVFAFTRPGDGETQAFARELGAEWAGGSDETPPEQLGAAIIFAPAGELVPAALRAVERGGVVVCAGIHMSALPAMPYELLWGERTLSSVANLTRRDGREFLELAHTAGLATRVTPYPLNRANEALADLRAGRFDGAAVLVPTGA